MDYVIIIALLASAALFGNLIGDYFSEAAQAPPQIVNSIVTIVLSDRMTYHAAQNICELCGWRLEKRGLQLILWRGYDFQHSATMVGA